MTEHAAVDISINSNGKHPSVNHHPKAIRIAAHIVSFVFHPLFIPTYIAAYVVFLEPYAFADSTMKGKIFVVASIFLNTALFPAFSVFLMRQLRFIDSIFLRTQRDRIIPYITSMIFYFWAWYVARNNHYDSALVAMLLGTFLSCIAGTMANIYFKISMHGLAVGALMVFFTWLTFISPVPMGVYLAVATFVTGLVCTARFIVSDHSPFEMYAALVAGAACQGVAILFATNI
jgi:hypothetical protein